MSTSLLHKTYRLSLAA